HSGEELLAVYRGTGTEPGGAIGAAEAAGAEVVPLLFAGALPSGTVRRDAFETLVGDLVSRAHDVDGVGLCLHCARVVQAGRPRGALVKLPLLTPPQVQGTDDEPMRSVRAAVDALKARRGIWSASFLPGFAYADVERLGFTVYVAADEDADGPATELARGVWA